MVSPNSVWQVEYVNPTRGSSIAYGSPVRFRHVSGAYLCITVVAITATGANVQGRGRRARHQDAGGDSCTYALRCVVHPTQACDFTLHPSGLERPDAPEGAGGPIPLTRHGLFIRHRHTKLWVHATDSAPLSWRPHPVDASPRPGTGMSEPFPQSASPPPLLGEPSFTGGLPGIPDEYESSDDSVGGGDGGDGGDGGGGGGGGGQSAFQSGLTKLRRIATAATWVSYYDDSANHEYFYDPATGNTAWVVRLRAAGVGAA